MDSLQLWILFGSIVCLLAAGLGYRALLRNKGRRRARRERLEAAAWAEAQRLVNEKAARHRARQEAAAQQAARDAAAERTGGARPSRFDASFRNDSANAGISATRCRSGGM